MALKGLKVVELAGLAPAPFCGMILSDFGASVTRVDRVGPSLDVDRLSRGKRSIAVNLKTDEGVDIVKRLCAVADVLIEPFRRGVMEKLCLGPDILIKNNQKLVYARLTGFGQHGPYAGMAGHDINYIALSGLLSMIGRRDENPIAPINLLGDFAGGGLMCALGICMALLERNNSGRGQIIDANMVEGAAYLGTWLWNSKDLFIWGNPRGCNTLDSGAHNYETYRTKDGQYVAVGALEPQFYAELVKGLQGSMDGINDDQLDKKKLSEIFASKTRDEWTAQFAGTDACVTPILNLEEAPHHPHNRARQTFVKIMDDNETIKYTPRPAPLLSRTPGTINIRNPKRGEHTKEILNEAGYSVKDIERLIRNGIVEDNHGLSAKL